MWISVVAIAIALALFLQVAAFFLVDPPYRAWRTARRANPDRAQ
jgi:hypothetical protein